MIYIFCGSYKALLFALYLKNLGKKITILSANKDLIKYCVAEKINHIEFERRPPFTSFFELFTYKKILNDVIKKINIDKDDIFILTGKMGSYEGFYFAKELSKRSRVYQKNPDREYKIFEPPRFKPFFIRGFIGRVFLKLVLGLDIMYYESNRDPRIGIDDNFLNKYNIKEYETDLQFEGLILEAIKKTKSNFKSYDNLIIDQGPITGIVTFDSIRKLYKNLFELPIGFAFKKHPSPTTKMDQSEMSFYKLFKQCEELPSYIPVEIFCNNIKKNVISLFSASLITASQLEHLKAISLLELVDWNHDYYKKEFKDHLMTQSKNKILFPKNFEELKEILLK